MAGRVHGFVAGNNLAKPALKGEAFLRLRYERTTVSMAIHKRKELVAAIVLALIFFGFVTVVNIFQKQDDCAPFIALTQNLLRNGVAPNALTNTTERMPLLATANVDKFPPPIWVLTQGCAFPNHCSFGPIINHIQGGVSSSDYFRFRNKALLAKPLLSAKTVILVRNIEIPSGYSINGNAVSFNESLVTFINVETHEVSSTYRIPYTIKKGFGKPAWGEQRQESVAEILMTLYKRYLPAMPHAVQRSSDGRTNQDLSLGTNFLADNTILFASRNLPLQ